MRTLRGHHGRKDGALCRAVVDIYRASLQESFEEVSRRVGSAVAACTKEAEQATSPEARLTSFTRCLVARVTRKR